ncbi:alanine racemase [Gorillibacterium timonense]|uniref:alanine racemase n=1 Tax=Gorillibacterium timonense TaxID=1689269 RepID=UPI00071E26C1|nr:alanine racemase [Gorillibacterium timonense]
MDSFYRSTRVEISLDALRHNIEAFRSFLPERIELMAVIKADAYGHGAVQVAQEALEHGVSYLAVAFLDEALELRQAGIDAPILVLGHTPVKGIELAASQGITLTAFSEEVLEALARRPADAPELSIHVKIDTGMGRLGLQRTEEAVSYIERALALPGVRVEGLFTHYACADETDKTVTLSQYERFKAVVDAFATKGISFPYIHAGNTAAAIDTPELTYNMVRLGIGMYGLYPSEEVIKENIELRPVMSIKAEIVHLKKVEAGAGISYGHRYHTQKDGEVIATLPIGYADGYSRMLTGKAEALVRGTRVPIVGTICMDQCMAEVTGVDGAEAGDEVVLLGSQGAETLSAEEIAAKLGTINYEITCMISHRVPRIYIRNGRVVHILNHLRHEQHTQE